MTIQTTCSKDGLLMVLTEIGMNIDDMIRKRKTLQNMASIYILPDHASDGGFAFV